MSVLSSPFSLNTAKNRERSKWICAPSYGVAKDFSTLENCYSHNRNEPWSLFRFIGKDPKEKTSSPNSKVRAGEGTRTAAAATWPRWLKWKARHDSEGFKWTYQQNNLREAFTSFVWIVSYLGYFYCSTFCNVIYVR